MKRRCCWAPADATTSLRRVVCMSSQGDSSVSGVAGWVAEDSSAQIICIQVVPHFDGV